MGWLGMRDRYGLLTLRGEITILVLACIFFYLLGLATGKEQPCPDRDRVSMLQTVLTRAGHESITMVAAPPLGSVDDRVAIVVTARHGEPRGLREALDDVMAELAEARR